VGVVRRAVPRIIAATILIVTGSIWALSAQSAPGATVTKPPGDSVGANLKVITWGFGEVTPGTTSASSRVVTNAQVVARVTALVNALPATVPNPRQVCATFFLLTPALVFSVSEHSAVVARVVFEIDGCPSVQVYQHAHLIAPKLGGPNVTSTYWKIMKLLNPHGITLR
jgi:hypothetical protein